MNKIIKYILSISMIFLICISNIKATEHSGSITVQLEDFKTSYQDVTLGYYQIAYYDQEYYLTEDFQNLNIDLEDIQHASETENFIQMLKTYIDDHDLEAVSQKTNEQGQLTFDDLTIGIYLNHHVMEQYNLLLLKYLCKKMENLFMMSKSIQKLNLFQQKLKMTMMNL